MTNSKAMFGMEEKNIKELVADYTNDGFSTPKMLAMSILSDVQHLIENGAQYANGFDRLELARQQINLAKHIMWEYTSDKEVSSD